MTRPLAGDLQFFFGTLPQPCPYLPDRIESKIVTDLSGDGAGTLHNELSRAGFRRSHSLAYKPACPTCNACVAVRIPVADFSYSRSLRRVWRRNQDLVAEQKPPQATVEQFMMFARYQRWRHSDGGMASMDYGDYRSMVQETPIDTMVVEFRDDAGSLMAATLSDCLGDGLSGVYKFFEPDAHKRSLGTYAVLWHVEHARSLGLPYVYLGYWIANCQKMSYKTRFRPIEVLGRDGWRRYRDADEDWTG